MDNACQPKCFHFVWGCEPGLPVDGVHGVLPYSRPAWRPEYLELSEPAGRIRHKKDTRMIHLVHPRACPWSLQPVMKLTRETSPPSVRSR